MKYSVIHSERVILELADIYDYIACELKSPAVAKNQIRRIFNEIDKLEAFPQRYALYKADDWENKKIRFFPVDNYIVFYTVDEINSVVYVLHVLYSGRDIKGILSKEQQP